MKTSILQRTTAWLCLAVALLTGLAPAQGFVICLEPDGCVSIEVASAAEVCGGCEPHQENSGATATVLPTSESAECPCLDLPVPGTSQDRRAPGKAVELRLGSWLASPASPVAQLLLPAPLAIRAPRVETPRPSRSLALIRTVVLLV